MARPLGVWPTQIGCWSVAARAHVTQKMADGIAQINEYAFY